MRFLADGDQVEGQQHHRPAEDDVEHHAGGDGSVELAGAEDPHVQRWSRRAALMDDERAAGHQAHGDGGDSAGAVSGTNRQVMARPTAAITGTTRKHARQPIACASAPPSAGSGVATA